MGYINIKKEMNCSNKIKKMGFSKAIRIENPKKFEFFEVKLKI